MGPETGTRWITHNSLTMINENGDIFTLKTRDARPRLVVSYKLTEEQEKIRQELPLEDREITAPFNPMEFAIFLENMKDIYAGNSVDQAIKETSVVCYYHIGKDGQRLEEKAPRTEIRFYLDTDNIFKIDVKDLMYKEGKVTTFKTGFFEWNKYYINGKEVPFSYLSKKHTKVYIDNMSEIMKNLFKNSGKEFVSQKKIINPQVQEFIPPKENNTGETQQTVTSVLSDVSNMLESLQKDTNTIG